MRTFLKYLGIFLLGLIAIYLLGPRVKYDTPKLLDTEISTSIAEIEGQIAAKEKMITDIKPGNEAKIIWANDSLKQQTEYCLLYIHGFSASEMEGDPVHRDFAKRYGMNLYLPRLEDHGRADTNSLMTLTPDNYLQSAEEAMDVAKILGKKVIVMSCSTGSTLGLILDAAGEKMEAHIMFSPNIDIADPMSNALVYPWGKQISSLVMNGEHNRINYTPEQQKYWNSIYHMNGVFAMKSMIKSYMTPETFTKIKTPTFLGYYYKDESHQDKVVSVARMLEMYDQISTPTDKKEKMAFSEAGHHVVCSSLVSKEIENIKAKSFAWAEKTLGLKPIH
jgi:esterase/lipase